MSLLFFYGYNEYSEPIIPGPQRGNIDQSLRSPFLSVSLAEPQIIVTLRSGNYSHSLALPQLTMGLSNPIVTVNLKNNQSTIGMF
jgi:hypothetical protein